VIKARHSIFYQTPLEYLAERNLSAELGSAADLPLRAAEGGA
jgi:hypothetical protein